MEAAKATALEGDWAKLEKLIRDIRIALLTTVDLDAQFHARPVQTLQLEGRDTLWFFTDWSSPKVHEMHQDVRVALGYADPQAHTYVAVSGSATLLRDPRKAGELWSIERAEYWIAPGPVSYLLAAAKAAVTHVPATVIGQNQKLD